MTVPEALRYYRPMVAQAARIHGLDARLVEAVVVQESAGKAHAYRYEPAFYERYLEKNPKFAGDHPPRISASYGLMQIMYSTAVEHGYVGEPEGLFIPQRNLDVGCLVLKRLLGWAEGNTAKALAAYNGGRGNWKAAQPQAYAQSVQRILADVIPETQRA